MLETQSSAASQGYYSVFHHAPKEAYIVKHMSNLICRYANYRASEDGGDI